MILPGPIKIVLGRNGVTTREPQIAPGTACRQCKHELVDKAKFCDSCGAATTALASDSETLQHYCGRCGGVLRGAKKYCSYCGNASPHSGKKKVQHDHWIFQAAEDPKIQISVVLALVLLASLPMFLPVRYGLTLTPPFFLVFDDGNAEVAARPLAAATWSARSIPGPGGSTGENAADSVTGVAGDVSGVYFVADTPGNAIYRISPDGSRELIAGGGQPGFSGDGGAATEAALNGPRGLAADTQGNLYVADTGNGRIRLIDAGGVIRTIAGCGVDCGTSAPAQAAALAVRLRPAHLAFVGSNLWVTESAGADAKSEPAVWLLQPGL